MTEPFSPLPVAPPPESPAPTEGARSVLWGWLRIVLLGAALVAVLLAPPFLFPKDVYHLGLFAKFMALALFAVSVDLVWGYTGLLSLGQGLFFGLGAYAVAYSLTLQAVVKNTDLEPGMKAPTFMESAGLAPNDPDYVPPPALALIAPLGNIWTAFTVAVVLPLLVAMLFGWVIFRLKIKGVYFALITQALLLAVFTLVYNQQRLTGGSVGLKDLSSLQLFGLTFNSFKPKYVQRLCFLNAGALLTCLLLCGVLLRTKFGKMLTAIRDNENRVLALGYNTAMYKTFIFGLAGGLAGLAGALFVAANGLAGPGYFSATTSIEVIIWVAIGGRGTLLGGVIGALWVGFFQNFINAALPDFWLIIQGLLFIGVVLFLPKGLFTLGGYAALFGALLGVVLVVPLRQYITATPELFLTFAGPSGKLQTKDVEFWMNVVSSGFLMAMVLFPSILRWFFLKMTGPGNAWPRFR